MKPIMYLLINSLAVYISAYILKGVHVRDFWVAVTVSVILGLFNMILKPILLFFTLPLNILTLGLFTLVINGLLVLLASAFVPGFSVDSLVWGILFSIVISFISSFFNWISR